MFDIHQEKVNQTREALRVKENAIIKRSNYMISLPPQLELKAWPTTTFCIINIDV